MQANGPHIGTVVEKSLAAALKGDPPPAETVQYHKLTPLLLSEVQRLSELCQTEKDKNLAHEHIIRGQNREIAGLKQQMASVQIQARQWGLFRRICG